jgi:hypothetical protein
MNKNSTEFRFVQAKKVSERVAWYRQRSYQFRVAGETELRCSKVFAVSPTEHNDSGCDPGMFSDAK